ncbi:unnamed protein product [Sympodiomycopsis kandeliae]
MGDHCYLDPSGAKLHLSVASFDRIDPRKGYSVENTRILCVRLSLLHRASSNDVEIFQNLCNLRDADQDHLLALAAGQGALAFDDTSCDLGYEDIDMNTSNLEDDTDSNSDDLDDDTDSNSDDLDDDTDSNSDVLDDDTDSNSDDLDDDTDSNSDVLDEETDIDG